ncbi:Potassium transporter 5 [Acorus calamus]|uniref:Potassium transporter 5 n=1 Tax=Acorus calamus TaxID=4465 RepID=A0AAV9F0I1_ACOCL|nr:Potassium transporter 5 [Acorus calamus]
MADSVQGNAAEMGNDVEMMDVETNLKSKRLSWGKLRHIDSLNLEAGRVSDISNHHETKLCLLLNFRFVPLMEQVGWKTTLTLAFQSIGVVYGDIGTSPLYVYSSTFTQGINEKEDILGVLSLILYTLLLIPMLKYVFIVLYANDNGDGGTFALYSLICRYAKVSLIPNHQVEDKALSNYKLEMPSKEVRAAEWIKEKLENSKAAQLALFLITILGTSMVIGDGILTPCISGNYMYNPVSKPIFAAAVLSAVGGIRESARSLNEDAIVGISIAILVLLFVSQHFGTDKVGYSFAPIILVWFGFIGITGIYNLFKHDVSVLRAFNPKYIVDYFRRNGKQGWVSLGGVVLCITGTEAMFADLGHFSVRAIQAAYLTKFPEHVGDTFYKSIPSSIYWPTFIVAVAAAIIASQAMISGAFSIISQSLNLGCFPRVLVVHTSDKHEGQVYIPEINYLLMFACVIVTGAFKTTEKIGNAYVLYKFTQGGFLPLAFAFFLMLIMSLWHYVHKKRYMFELQNKVSSEYIRDLAMNPNLQRIPGIGLLYSELVQGIPPIFPHFITSIPSIHSVFVFVSIKRIPISKVTMAERFLFRQVEPREYRMFRCVVRYGYNDVREGPDEFEHLLVEHLKEFIHHEQFFLESASPLPEAEGLTGPCHEEKDTKQRKMGSTTVHTEETLQQYNPPRLSLSESTHQGTISHSARSSSRIMSVPIQGVEEEVQFVNKAMEKGVVYLIGEAEVVAEPHSSLFKRVVVNYIYNMIRRNTRQGETMMSIPHGRLLRIGMTYDI